MRFIKIKSQFCIVATCVILGISLSSYAERPKTLHYGHPDQFVLTAKVNPDGAPDNPLLRLAKALMSEIDIEVTSGAYPAARMYKRIIDGKIDFMILVNAPILEKCCIASSTPIMTTKLRVYRKSSSPAINRIEDLAHKKIITIRGYSYGRFKRFLSNAPNHITRFQTDTHQSAFAMLAANRADYVLDYIGPSVEILEQNPIDDVTYDELETIYVYLFLQKHVQEAELLMKQLEQAAKRLDIKAILNLPEEATPGLL